MKLTSFLDIKAGYDIVIVGAGPAGCSVAKYLSPSYSTLLIDSRSLPRDKPCGGILVNPAISLVEKQNPPADIFVNPKELAITYLDLDNSVEKHSNKRFLNVDRKKFDEWLFTQIKSKSISVSDNTRLIDFYFSKNGEFIVLVLESEGSVRTIVTKYLIGCDGAFSLVRRKINAKSLPYYIAIQQVFDNPGIDCAYFVYDNSVTDFYSWIIPKDGKILVGSALLPLDSKAKFDLFKKKISNKFKLTGAASLSSALICRPNSVNDIFLGQNNVFLIGESAGLISPSSGEGISFALESGMFCAESLNADPKFAFKKYVKKCEPLIKRVASKIKKSNLIKNSAKRIILMEK